MIGVSRVTVAPGDGTTRNTEFAFAVLLLASVALAITAA